jgi:hypothetical protein
MQVRCVHVDVVSIVIIATRSNALCELIGSIHCVIQCMMLPACTRQLAHQGVFPLTF